PYGIPLRSCYSRNIRNLLTAGRPISASYVAFASSRVLPTGSMVGQAVGAAAALCRRHQCDPRTLAEHHASELQQLLLRQDCFVPGVENQDPNDLARQAQATASSEAPLFFAEDGQPHELRLPAAQLFPVSTGRLDAVELLLSSSLAHDVTLELGLRPAAHVWDFRSTQNLARARATLRAGHRGFVRFEFHRDVPANALYYVHLAAQTGVSWLMMSEKEGEPSHNPAGASAADLPGTDYWRPISGGRSFVVRVSPEQRPYGPGNLIRGGSRPDRWTNLYQSDPAAGLPVWVELRWPRPVRFNQVEVTFDTDVNRRIVLPLFRYPDCVRDYDIAVRAGAGWKTLAAESGNYFRRRIHRLEPVSTDRLRLNVTATNGTGEARIYSVRVYNEAG
ncbi:MAG: FAD-dependent oxidoreductase, partial [Bryobacteraceae bacterium]